MLDKNKFIEGMNMLIVSYPNWKFDIENKFALKVWYDKFKHMDNERFIYMINAYNGFDERYPTIAGLKKCDTIPRKSHTQIEHEKMLAEQAAEKRAETQ